MILKNKKKLDISYIPSKILCRNREMKRLSMLLDGGRVLISGGVGTGKTLLAKYSVMNRKGVYVNCFVNRSERTILEASLKQLKPFFNPAGLPTQKLWDEISGESSREFFLILDEIDGISDDLNHFTYTLSRIMEYSTKINYIAITRDAGISKQRINDDAVWSTFAEKAIVELKSYTREQMIQILEYRAGESLYGYSFNYGLLSLIADIASQSSGHMRTGIDILRNSAIIAENEDHGEILPEDVKRANTESWMDDMENITSSQSLTLLCVAHSCKKRAYVNIEDIFEEYKVICERYGIEIDENIFKKTIEELVMEGFIHENQKKYTILNCPSEILIEELEKLL